MVQQAVQDRGGNHGIAEHAAPFSNRAVRGDQDRSLLIAARDQLEEQVRGIGLEGQIAQLVNDQQLRPAQERQLLVECFIIMGLGQDRDQRRCRDKLDGVVLPDRLPAIVAVCIGGEPICRDPTDLFVDGPRPCCAMGDPGKLSCRTRRDKALRAQSRRVCEESSRGWIDRCIAVVSTWVQGQPSVWFRLWR